MDPDPSFPIAKDSLMICMPHRLLKVKNTSSEVGMGQFLLLMDLAGVDKNLEAE
jgi:hypothetical protein